MESSDLLALILSGISALFISVYYMNKKQSVCCECDEVISHRKQNSYYLEKGGEKLALCKKCYNSSTKQAALKAQHCSCCSKGFTTRMKISEWQGEYQSYFLCVKCDKLMSKKVERRFLFNELLHPDFIQLHSNYENIESMVSSSGISLSTQEELSSEAWNTFIATNTSFLSWHEMKICAETLMLKRQSDRIVMDLRE